MIFNWPQITMIILLVLEMHGCIYRCIKKDGKIGSAIFASFVRVGTLVFVLIKGGFFE